MSNSSTNRWKAYSSAVGEPLAISLIIVVLVVNGALAYINIHQLAQHNERVAISGQLLVTLKDFESTLKDAEASQRGFLLTGEESYLNRFRQASLQAPRVIEQISQLTGLVPSHQRVIPELQRLMQLKFDEMQRAIEARREQGLDAAKQMVQSNLAQRTMELLIAKTADMQTAARSIQETRRDSAELSKLSAIVATLATLSVSLVLVGGLLYLIHGNRRRRDNAAALILTQQQQLHMSDRQLRLFVEQVSDYAIFMISPDLKAKTWNQGVEQVLGYAEDEFIGLDIIPAIFTPEAIANGSALAEFEKAAEQGEAGNDRWMQTKNGAQFWASGITTGVRDADGVLLGYNKVLRNLTERKLAEDELKTLAAELSERDRNKTTFLATLAHELRNPLAPIKNTVQLLSLSELDQETQELLDIVQRQTDQMVRLIDDLMDISRISRGRIELKKERLPLADLVDTAVEACQPLIINNGQRLQVHPPNLDIHIDADPARMTQVISNLLTNASKYSDAGGHIEVVYGTSDEQVFLEVRDDGIGIPPEDLEDIFKMFSQGVETIERGSSGLGIGLTLVRSLVELHGGSVTAYSVGVGHGSRFRVLLPLSNGSSALNIVQLESDASLPFRSYKVLVVDDSRSITLVMARLLTKLGHEVQTAENGLRALDVLSGANAFQPDVIFSDISMPGMNGYELVRHLRSQTHFQNLWVVAMTGFGQEADRRKAFEAGFSDHAVKPVDVRLLRQIFAKLALDHVSQE